MEHGAIPQLPNHARSVRLSHRRPYRPLGGRARRLGVGFLADYLARTDSGLVPVLPVLKIPPLPIWLTVHREIRASLRIRAVYDFLAGAVPKAL